MTVHCVFATDILPKTHKLYTNLQNEQLKYKDMHFQVSMSRMDFGGRLFYQMYWSYLMYDYDYFLHLDDDYFLCIERLLNELPIPRKSIQYGYIHCNKNIVSIFSLTIDY